MSDLSGSGRSMKYVLCRLYYQIQQFWGGLMCVHGGLFDIAIDLHKNSPTFSQRAGASFSARDIPGISCEQVEVFS
ncbi:dTDP-4-dehydrorhamnose 3,5-epimerase family protein [Nitrosomonas sp.]|uniref:dTDP-4-dehydrorhamnose 3,5-epimerase family protein n=1 Tax=Nitrosomonas sp. TaxID=42353 RepID=UPI0025E6DA6A|nr:dTDP-4-dehydrorhamnose 3,5-epimerase family protein [Nitrosomonas sp.]